MGKFHGNTVEITQRIILVTITGATFTFPQILHPTLEIRMLTPVGKFFLLSIVVDTICELIESYGTPLFLWDLDEKCVLSCITPL
jgi:hypothetical protein